jgi:mRNA-degrading endonuclease toxin of MazEF toxin-antitoxin module
MSMTKVTAMPFEPGRLLLVAFPFTDNSAAKQRPVLVVSGIGFNQGEDVVVVPLSSRITPDDPLGFPLRETEPYFSQTRLRLGSTVKWTKPMTISSSVVTRKLGTIPAAALSEVQEKIRSLFR